MSRSRSSNFRLGALLVACLLLLAATPACIAGHCGATAEHDSTPRMAMGMACCTVTCPMRESKPCDLNAPSDTAEKIPATPAVPSFRIIAAPVSVIAVAALPAGPAAGTMRDDIELDGLDSSPPIHLLNNQFLI